MNQVDFGARNAIRVQLEVWHPGCWVLETSEQVDVGFLGYGVFTRADNRATTRYTLYADTHADIEEAISLLEDHPAVYTISEMCSGVRTRSHSPGNVTRELLIENDATTQISDAFTSRGFTYGAPGDIYDGIEHWRLFAQMDRETVYERLDEIRDEEQADITVVSISSPRRVEEDPLPVDKLSHRQREIFQLARTRGYYRRPKRTTAGELAEELGITTSTFHEHLHKAEEKLLDLS
jgi:hypothetical protein